MNLNDILKKTIKDKNEEVDKNINISKIQLLVSLGIRIVLIYMLFIFFVGKYIANILGFKNLYFVSIILGTLANVYIVFEILKKYFKK